MANVRPPQAILGRFGTRRLLTRLVRRGRRVFRRFRTRRSNHKPFVEARQSIVRLVTLSVEMIRRVARVYANCKTLSGMLGKVILITGIGILSNELITKTQINPRFLDPGQGFFDIDLSDYLVSQSYQHLGKLDKNNPFPTSPILLIDVTRSNRSQLAALLDCIAPHHPRAVGLDLYFEQHGSPAENHLLRAALQRQQRVVLANRLTKTGEPIPLDPMFADLGTKGVINFIAHDSTSVIRFIPTGLLQAGKLPFSAALIATYDSTALQDFQRRGNDRERIHYNSTVRFKKLTAEQFLSTTDTAELNRWVMNKLVMLGNLGLNSHDQFVHDLHFTPTNLTYIGKSFPDMYGLMIQAYATQMILQRTYYNESPYWLNLLVAALWVYVNLRLTQHLEKRRFLLSITSLVSLLLLLIIYMESYQRLRWVFDADFFLKISVLSLLINDSIIKIAAPADHT